MLVELYRKYKFDTNADRLGPDCPFTHWKLYFKSTMRTLCKRKFKAFGDGADFRAGAFAFGCSNISLGKRVVVRPTSMIFSDPSAKENGAVIIEDDVMMGSGVHIYVANHRFDLSDVNIIDQGHYPSKTVVLKEGCWIGANAIILAGVTIGKNSVVGAGSVVTKSFPDRVLVAGAPAKIVKYLDKVDNA